ncbi:hypothetical protein QEM13_004352 [Pseudomonas putida]|nr:hypothetical protein [Pseudomonas putida]
MQQNSSPATGNLLGTYGYGKALIISLVIIGIVCLGLAAFVGFLSTMLPTDVSGPISVETRRGATLQFDGPQSLVTFSIGLLAVLALCMFGLAMWQKKLRNARYEVYEKGICQIIGTQRDYVPFSEMNDLYLFASGQTAVAGLHNNLAYRRDASEPFRRVNPHLKDLYAFIDLVRDQHLNERLPSALATLENGGAVRFSYIDSAQVWGKRMKGDFFALNTKTLTITRDALDVDRRRVPMSSLRNLDLNAWTERVVIKDESGQTVLSTVGSGIMSFDVFINTLHSLLQAPKAQAGEVAQA